MARQAIEAREHPCRYRQQADTQKEQREGIERPGGCRESTQQKERSEEDRILAADRRFDGIVQRHPGQNREHLEKRPQHKGEHHAQRQHMRQDQGFRGGGLQGRRASEKEPDPGGDSPEGAGQKKTKHHGDRRGLIERESAVLEHSAPLLSRNFYGKSVSSDGEKALMPGSLDRGEMLRGRCPGFG